jgi:epoxyqueuosine reductase
VLDEARSIIVVALPYPRARDGAAGAPVAPGSSAAVANDPAGTSAARDPAGSSAAPASDRPPPSAAPPSDDRPRGVVARYARGADYHWVMRKKLDALAAELPALAGRPVTARACVDSAPLLEREAAARAGVGFVSVSTMTIVPGIGTYVLLGELLVDLDLPPDAPAHSRCGTCDICRAACPTGAIVDRYVVDARRCISYLTIELTGVMPRELRPLVGTRVFGCDVCQDVCPFNGSKREKPSAPELAPRARLEAPVLEELLGLGSKPYGRFVDGTALERVSRNQLARNAAVALGNAGDARAVPALARALGGHPSANVRLHAGWALGRLGGEAARAALGAAAAGDADEAVREECRSSLAALMAVHTAMSEFPAR